MKNNTILLVGGGTGGHIVPIFEIYKELKKNQSKIKIKMIGSDSPIDRAVIGDNSDYLVLKTGKLHRSFTLKNLAEFGKLVYGFMSAFFLLMSLRPKVIFSKGGFVSLPIIFWSKVFKISYCIHESDTEMGSANKYAASSAKIIFTGFPLENYSKEMRKKAVYSGQIIKSVRSQEKASPFSTLKPVVFVTGGSQGSLNINRNFYPVLPEVLKSYNVIHQAGSNDREHLVFAAEYGGSYISKDFFSDDEMAENIKISDIIITRAGATTLAEIADQSKPMIIIPYKYASGNHQSKNADVYRQKNAAIVIQDDDLSPTLLATTIRELESDHEKMELLGNNAKNNFGLNALSLICKTILEEVK